MHVISNNVIYNIVTVGKMTFKKIESHEPGYLPDYAFSEFHL